ncbi:nucleotidyltransferase family protein [Methylomarinum sp. Ch1-1]|uniref:Nucleotidyltransferase family protein n=1 Tax=Methylomarinum roseum TaxID=3067653 RepID=A0AAU7NVW3_9GAMM|nr:nucleotidyltransferase family protein [Methylomarinum sp. Ch1-1]MDP4522902.1 nucleotidyltransferase family protein [Methylomarinum sp. Ch1-1]
MTASSADIYAIILAAGASSRLGRPKQLLRWQNRSLLEQAIANATSLLPGRVLVVLGAHAEAIETDTALANVHVVYNPDWREGIASSIRAGIHALPASTEAALMLLCDQPLLAQSHLETLINAWRREPSRIAASHYHDAPGVPALFPAAYFGELLKLQGDKGAKRLLHQHRQTLAAIPLQAAALDIDCADDFNQLRGHYHAEE